MKQQTSRHAFAWRLAQWGLALGRETVVSVAVFLLNLAVAPVDDELCALIP